MVVGCLGDIAFEVSSEIVKTVNKLKWSGSTKYATHQRIGINALTEFVSIDPERISLNVMLSAYLGVDVQEEINKILKYERDGTALSFVLGEKKFGKYRWTVINHDITATHYDGAGNILSADVSISLQEYLKS